MAGVTEEELAAIVSSAKGRERHGLHGIQSTRPHSLGFGLDDSPLGLAGWILEKFHAWCDIRDGHADQHRPADRQPDDVLAHRDRDVGRAAVLRVHPGR